MRYSRPHLSYTDPMPKQKLNLMSREEFAALSSLHDKNQYLQAIARRIAEEGQGEEFVPLSKDSLSLLRRFYMRRSFADLHLDQMENDQLRDALKRYAEGIRSDEMQKIIAHELPSKPAKVVRSAPVDDAQMMFFVPSAYDAPVKDDVNLMDIAPFVLTKATREGDHSLRAERRADHHRGRRGGRPCNRL